MIIRLSSISLITLLLFAVVAAPVHAQNMPDLNQEGPAGSVLAGQPAMPSGPSSNGNILNYTRSYMPRVPLTDTADVNNSSAPAEVAASTEYRDGFGRTMLQIQHNFIDVSGTIKHLVQPYDTRVRRDQVSYLPYTSTNNGLGAATFSYQKSYYQSMYPEEEGLGYSLSRYQSAAGYRQQTSYAPGLSQVGQYRGTTKRQVNNNANEVRIWKLNTGGTPQSSGFYAANNLMGTLSYDTSGAEVLTYSAKDGSVVYKQVLLYTTVSGSTVTKTFARTYYVYDELGRLRFILPPRAVDLGGTAPSGTILQNLCFEYRYGSKNRVIASHQPGEDGFTEIVYDQYDRPVMRQTPLLAASTQWELTFYDKLGRVIATSLYTSSRTRDWLQNMLDTTDPESTTLGSTALVYYLVLDIGIGKYPSETDLYANTMMSYTWYDDYGHATNAESRYNSTVSALSFTEYSQVAGAENPVRSLRTQGMEIGGRTRLLPAAGVGYTKVGKWRNNLSWYDDKGRAIYNSTIDSNNTATAIHKIYSGVQHHFSYGTLVSKQVFINQNSIDGYNQHIELLHKKYENLTGRLQQLSHKVDDGDWELLSSYAYDGMGRLRRKEQGVGGEIQDYSFNIRGQLTGINGYYAETSYKEGAKRSFGESLKYDYGYQKLRYDGRVSGMIWRGASGSTGPTAAHSYGYDYDRSSRLLSADYYQQVKNGLTIIPWNKSSYDYTVSNLSYDNNGNLNTIKQQGVKPGGSPVDMDELTYIYETQSNRLKSIQDDAVYLGGMGDFEDANTTDTDYKYDQAGNLRQDLNKGISTVLNNRFNKPEKVTFSNGNTIIYSYDAAGAKLQELRYDAATSKTTRLDYIGGYVYRNDSLQYLNSPEGRTVFNADSNSFKEEYYVKDHLGNIRSVIDCKVYAPIDYLAGYEVASANLEGMIFDHHDPIRDDKPGGGGGDSKAGNLNGADPERRIGTALLLKVMAGDQIGMTVNSFYEGYDKGNDRPVSAADMLSSIVSTLTTGSGGFGGSESHDPGMVSKMFNTTNYTSAFTDILDSINNPSRPRAYLNYMFFNDRMQLVPEASGAFQATGDGTWMEIGSPYPVEMPQNGYFAVFLSNATDMMGCLNCGDVFFDQMVITFSKANMLEETHYYPHGLPMVALGSQANSFSGNRLRYQSNEQLKELNLGWMDFHNRQYDPQIGRFLSVDPLAASGGQDRLSPFQAMGNDPVSLIDPFGLQSFHNRQLPARAVISPVPGLFVGRNSGGPGSDSEWFMYLGIALHNQAVMTNYAIMQARKISGGSGGLGNGNPGDGFIPKSANLLKEANGVKTYGWWEQIGSDFVRASALALSEPINYGFSGGGVTGSVNLDGLQSNGGERSGLDNANILLGTLSIAQGAQEGMIRLAPELKGLSYVKGLKATGVGLGVVSGAISVTSVLYNSSITASNVLDATVTAVSFIPGFGWAIGGGYFITDLIVTGVTGESIGQHLDNAVGRPLIDWDW